ncbi:hypothetical protein [Nocardioides sp.]|uniref:hypothetical protein n=1 Tax=Nocardioides sp. TaxID=35761 RepID=UPI00260DB03E|nr:hypothetical protein [Nocardioides sp.]MCW2736790.1 hypothetical protein [Nocardioides sp.]
MTKGPRRLVLDQYLDSAAEGAIKGAGHDWKNKADDLRALGDALKQAAQQAELRIGEQTLTGPALRASMEQSSTSMITKAEQLRAAGEALTQVGQQIADTRDSRDALADLGAKPSPYQAPAGTPGVEPTAEEIQAQADASQARQSERSAWQTQYDKQEAKSLALTKEMDAAFLGAIPPMKEIHGQKDPTEPPPNVPSGPGGTYLPGTQAPPVTGGGNNGGNDGGGLKPTFDGGKDDGGKDDGGRDDGGKDKPPTTTTPPPPTVVIETGTLTPPEHPTHVNTEGPTTTVTGTSQNGVTYQPTGPSVSAAPSAGVSSAGVSAAALGAAGGAGGMAAGAVRPGSMGAASTSGSAPVRAIGSTGRAGSPGALSRSAGSSAAGRSASSTGSPASRSAGSATGRGASTGSSAGRGGAGSRGAGTGSSSRSGGRGSSGARGSGTGTSGTRGGRKGERDKTTDRDSLVYDQDWLGDDDVAPGVLD